MEKIKKENVNNIFESSKKTFALIDKVFKKSEETIFVKSQLDGEYSLFDKDNNEVCKTQSLYNCLIGYLYYNCGVGKNDMPSWTKSDGEEESDFNKVLDCVEQPKNNFENLEKCIDSGGTFYYSSSNNIIGVKMPSQFDFREDLAFKTSSFSSGAYQIDKILSVLEYSNSLEQ